eukprot:GILJ01000926.1.p1 GENE.GILJ01000926.1~~GILJ01000926.1.p1  ORF type:complete len:157 (+),score=34.21 GILJ01000926.1:34-504(+)
MSRVLVSLSVLLLLVACVTPALSHAGHDHDHHDHDHDHDHTDFDGEEELDEMLDDGEMISADDIKEEFHSTFLELDDNKDGKLEGNRLQDLFKDLDPEDMDEVKEFIEYSALTKQPHFTFEEFTRKVQDYAKEKFGSAVDSDKMEEYLHQAQEEIL